MIMKKRSRILAFLLAVFMVASLIPITVVTASAAEVQTPYGKIDETAYPAAEFPFAVFWNGQFMGAYALWADNNDSAIDSALERVREMTVGMPDEIDVTVLLRDNYTMQVSDGSRDRYNNFAHIGRMTLDLNGKVFNATSSQAMFVLSPKHTNINSLGMDISDQFITVKNGTINIGTTSLVTCAAASNLDNYARNKHINFEFDGVTFNSTAACSYPMMSAPSCGHLKNTLYISYEYNNCTFDITGNTATTVTLFRPHNPVKSLIESSNDVSVDPVHTTVTVKGGNIKANSIDNLVLGQVNYGTDTVSFVKDGNGKYTTLTVPKDYAVPATVYGVIRDGGVDTSANFTGAETTGTDTKTVELKKVVYTAGQDYITPYGKIPASDYDPTNYPFAIFADGSYAGRATNWSNDGTGALAKARDQVSKNNGNGKITTQILLLRDYAIAENSNAGADQSYSNMSHYGHTLLIDLGGHKMTMNEGPSNDDYEMLNLIARTMSTAVPPANNTIIVKNGELVPEGAPIVTNAVQNNANRMSNYTHAVRYTVLFKDVQFTVPAEKAFPIVVTAGTVSNDNELGGDHDIRFEDCVFDLSAVSSSYRMFTGADNQKRDRVDITLNGGKIIGDLSKITFFNGDENDSFSFARSRVGLFTDLQTTVPFTGAIKTQYDGDMYYAATATEGLYTLVYKTPYGDIPQKYDPFYYPFAVFAEGQFKGAFVAWMKDNCPSAIWMARELAVNKSKAPQILMRRDYIAPNVKGDANAGGTKTIPYDNNVYGNMGHFTQPLTIDLGSYTFSTQNGMPFLNIKAQAFGRSYPTTLNFTIKGGTIITSKTYAMIGYTQNVAARDQYYTTPQTYNINFVGTTFQISATDGREFIQLKEVNGNTNDRALGAVWNLTMDNCTFDSTKRGSTGAYNPFIVNDAVDNNNANIIINGGSFTFSNKAAITQQIAALGAHDTLRFGSYNGAYTTMTVPTANTYAPTGVAYNTVDGGKLVFNLTNTTDTAKTYTLSACTHAQGTTCQVACTVCGAFADHIYGDWTQTDTEHCKECGTCPAGDKEITDKGAHIYDDVCDTTCNTCFYVRVAPHDFTIGKSETEHWLYCSLCTTEKAGSRVAHSVGDNGTAATCTSKAVCGDCGTSYGSFDENNHHTDLEWTNDGTSHWQDCPCGDAINSGLCAGGDDPTCTKKSVCDTCNREYGELDPDNHDATGVTEWQKDTDGHWQICNCGTDINYAEHASDTWISENGQHRKECDICGQVFAQGECYGGEATCGAPAVCEECNNPYGDTDAGGHKPDGVWVSDGTKHWQTCTVDGCGAKVYEDYCYGGYATCTEKAECDECGFKYGEVLPHDYDGDCDKECNNCDEGSRTNTSAHSYQNTCDSVCDICREVRSITHTFSNDCDASCDICYTNRTVGAHKGGTATCSKKAVCTSCGAEYGELTDHSYSSAWAYNAVKHWHECSCGAKTAEDFHTLGEAVDGKKSCSCGYTVNAVSPTVQTDVQRSNKAQVTTTIILGSAVGAGGIGIALWLLLSKKPLI